MAKASDFLIAFDGGHGANTPGKCTPFIKSLGRQIREHEFNQPVANFYEAELKRCGFRTIQLAPGDADTSLKSRTDDANKAGADLYNSLHFNASDGKFDGDSKDPSGFSAHIFKGNRNKPAGIFSAIALKHLAQGTAQKNRGIVEQDLHITRETKMPSVLFEFGFMDNEREALLMLDVSFQKECARELAMAVCEFYRVPYVAEVTSANVTKPIVEGDESEMFVLNSAEKKRMAEIFVNARKAGTFSSDEHEKAVMDGTMSLSKAIYLIGIIANSK